MSIRWSFVLLLVVGLGGVASAQNTYRLRGKDTRKGSFQGTVRLKWRTDSRVWIERKVTYSSGGTELWSGLGKRSGVLISATLRANSGMTEALRGKRRGPRVRFHLRLGGDRKTCHTQCRSVRRRSSARGQAVRKKKPQEGYGKPLTKKQKLMWDPLPPPERRWPNVIDQEGQPTLEGTTAEGFHVFKGTPFIEGKDDGIDIHSNDPDQGHGLVHCYFASALIAIAHTDPEWIRSMITDHEDGTYSVYFRGVLKDGKDQRIKIDGSLPFKTTDSGERVATFMTMGDWKEVGDETYWELWPKLIEKAWAVHEGSYNEVEWGRASQVFKAISGKPGKTYSLRKLTDAQILKVLQRAIREGHPVAAGSKRSPSELGPSDVNITGLHSYVLWKLEDGKIRLRNPWQTSHPSRAITPAELRAMFSRIYVAGF